MVRRLVVAAAFALLCLSSGTAHAYVIGGPPWPGHTIRYFNADTQLARPIAIAVRAWNTSGANLRFVPVPRKRAAVIIRAKRPPTTSKDRGLCGGYASVGHYSRVEYVDLDPSCNGTEMAAAVVAHELGHILGLDHASGACAAMTPAPDEMCRLPTLPWQYRCRLVQPDDVRGAIALYGGRQQPKPAFCDVFKPPQPATRLNVSSDGHFVAWHNPPLPLALETNNTSPRLSVLLGFQPETCPNAVPNLDAFDTEVNAIPARDQSIYIPAPAPGRWCVIVFVRDQYGRGALTSALVTVTASPIVASYVLAPLEQRCFRFFDSSTDDSGQIVDWRWDFGDGTAVATSQIASHCFKLAGLYSVRLSVTDDAGRTATIAQSVETF
jgi:hypothetical protein